MQRAVKGRRLSIKAKTWNSLEGLLRDEVVASQVGDPFSDEGRSTVSIHNSTDTFFEPGEAIGLEGFAIEPRDNSDDWRHSDPTFNGVSYVDHLHRTRYAIADEAIEPGVTGRAVLSGLAIVWLDSRPTSQQLQYVQPSTRARFAPSSSGLSRLVFVEREPASQEEIDEETANGIRAVVSIDHHASRGLVLVRLLQSLGRAVSGAMSNAPKAWAEVLEADPDNLGFDKPYHRAPITAVDGNGQTFTISTTGSGAVLTDHLIGGAYFSVDRSTANDGKYTVDAIDDLGGSAYRLTVAETVADETVDGEIVWPGSSWLEPTGEKLLVTNRNRLQQGELNDLAIAWRHESGAIAFNLIPSAITTISQDGNACDCRHPRTANDLVLPVVHPNYGDTVQTWSIEDLQPLGGAVAILWTTSTTTYASGSFDLDQFSGVVATLSIPVSGDHATLQIDLGGSNPTITYRRRLEDWLANASNHFEYFAISSPGYLDTDIPCEICLWPIRGQATCEAMLVTLSGYDGDFVGLNGSHLLRRTNPLTLHSFTKSFSSGGHNYSISMQLDNQVSLPPPGHWLELEVDPLNPSTHDSILYHKPDSDPDYSGIDCSVSQTLHYLTGNDSQPASVTIDPI